MVAIFPSWGWLPVAMCLVSPMINKIFLLSFDPKKNAPYQALLKQSWKLSSQDHVFVIFLLFLALACNLDAQTLVYIFINNMIYYIHIPKKDILKNCATRVRSLKSLFLR